MKKWIAIACALLLALIGVIGALRLGNSGKEDAPTPLESADSESTLAPTAADPPELTVEVEEKTEAVQQAPDPAGKADEKYRFTHWEQALDEFARQVGLEYDRLTAEGSPQPEVNAYQNVQDAMINDPEFLQAMIPYIPAGRNSAAANDGQERIPQKLWGPLKVLVRVGRIPEDRLYWKAALANGEIYRFEPHQELRIRWQERYPPPIDSDFGKKQLEQYNQTIKHVNRLAALGRLDAAEAEKMLKSTREQIESLYKERIETETDVIGPGDSIPEDEKEIIRLDLGVIDKGK